MPKINIMRIQHFRKPDLVSPDAESKAIESPLTTDFGGEGAQWLLINLAKMDVLSFKHCTNVLVQGLDDAMEL